MKKFRKAKCPYCGKKLSFWQTWAIKTKGEYECPKCSSFSNIELDFSIFPYAITAIILSGLIYSVSIFLKIPFSILLIFIILLPYFIFYFLSVFLVRLRKPAVRKKTHDGYPKRTVDKNSKNV